MSGFETQIGQKRFLSGLFIRLFNYTGIIGQETEEKKRRQETKDNACGEGTNVILEVGEGIGEAYAELIVGITITTRNVVGKAFNESLDIMYMACRYGETAFKIFRALLRFNKYAEAGLALRPFLPTNRNAH